MAKTKRKRLGCLLLDNEDAALIREALYCWKNDAHLDGCSPEYEGWIDGIILNLDAAMTGVQPVSEPEG